MQKEWQDICAFGRKNNFWRNFAGFLLLLPTWKYTLIIVNLGVGGIVQTAEHYVCWECQHMQNYWMETDRVWQGGSSTLTYDHMSG